MPYISPKQRTELQPHDSKAVNVGELTYMLTKVVIDYIDHDQEPLSYQKIAEVVGALDCTKMEFYRRMAIDYEDAKIEVNGDVY